jgi:hypothetical protein
MVGAQVRLHRKSKRWRGESPTPKTIFNLNCMPQFNNFYLNLNFLNSGIASFVEPLKNKSQLLKYIKCKVPFLLLIILPFFANSQNLVPNWSFEEYSECPDNISIDISIELAIGWQSFRVTPDYFNACSSSGSGVPVNALSSYAPAIHGAAYGGVVRNHNNLNSEVLAIELSEQLVIGNEYYVSFYLRRPNYNSNCWNNNMGATFTGVAYQAWPLSVAMPLNNYAHILYEEMFVEPDVWTKVEGYFVADSSYSFIAIGYHFDENHMDIDCEVWQNPLQTYYFVDCVCVSLNPDLCPVCDTTTQLEEENFETNSVQAYPNPFVDNCQVVLPKQTKGVIYMQLFNSNGVLINKWIESTGHIIEISSEIIKEKGLYILEVTFESGQKSHIKLLKM